MRVLAAPGIKVPQEEKPRDYITDTPPEGEEGYVVPDTAYYLRRVSDGDLIDLDVAVEPPAVVAAPVNEPVKSKRGGN